MDAKLGSDFFNLDGHHYFIEIDMSSVLYHGEQNYLLW